eukprot:1692248-Alexandrium_andersonii.AAC.1
MPLSSGPATWLAISPIRVRAPILERAEQAMTKMAFRNVRFRCSLEAMLRQPMQPGRLRPSSPAARLPMF